ncbi:DUF4321 domain-containing protein [Pelotomaculum propionicicum]|uniref:DUF4321 domain-containing protein n=1 Tax=Pelotomaculum propionicicum TaxID=258475 RepID=A0A4Y7RUV5_9FIRM|nr:DUF4321 domain-containing protein [Pelotomaculum propionicicum]NLI14598.1 DUF4321 domain-containing protein [Peptococcaceae bacterium]TEB12745.1 hypothetical protein Pmgp_00720 [Pelotomaculum propionicicum]
MAKNFKSYGNTWILVLLILIGGLTGSAVGDTLTPVLPWLKSTSQIGLKPSTLDLGFLNLTFGFTFSLGPLTALGMILGYVVYRRI